MPRMAHRGIASVALFVLVSGIARHEASALSEQHNQAIAQIVVEQVAIRKTSAYTEPAVDVSILVRNNSKVTFDVVTMHCSIFQGEQFVASGQIVVGRLAAGARSSSSGPAFLRKGSDLPDKAECSVYDAQ